MRRQVHLDIAQTRRIEYLINTPEFENFWNELNFAQQCYLEALVFEYDLPLIHNFMEENPIKEIAEFGFKRLRGMAKKMGIKYYSSMTKIELITAVNRRQIHEQIRKD